MHKTEYTGIWSMTMPCTETSDAHFRWINTSAFTVWKLELLHVVARHLKLFCLIHQIRGFQTQMEKWMAACDCIIMTFYFGLLARLQCLLVSCIDWIWMAHVFLAFAGWSWYNCRGTYKRTSYILNYFIRGILRHPLLFLQVSLSLIWFTEPKQRYYEARWASSTVICRPLESDCFCMLLHNVFFCVAQNCFCKLVLFIISLVYKHLMLRAGLMLSIWVLYDSSTEF